MYYLGKLKVHTVNYKRYKFNSLILILFPAMEECCEFVIRLRADKVTDKLVAYLFWGHSVYLIPVFTALHGMPARTQQ